MSDREDRPSKRSARASARRLRQRADWDPVKVLAARPSPQEQLDHQVQISQNESTYDQAEHCHHCVEARNTLNDVTALCDTHLAQAMGLADI
jgi:hypothetical protein